jgi:hypothetical protein
VCQAGEGGLDCPLLEEYDYAHDTVSPTPFFQNSLLYFLLAAIGSTSTNSSTDFSLEGGLDCLLLEVYMYTMNTTR